MTKILITKIHSMYQLSCEYNKGSAAVMSTAIKILKQRIPDAEFTSFIQFSEEFIEEHGIRVIRHNKMFSVRKASLGTIVKSSLDMMRCALWALLHKRFPWFAKALVSSRKLKEYADADVIIDISMTVYTSNFAFTSAIEHSMDLLLGVFLKKPVIIWAQSLGPFRSKLTARLARFVLNRVALITVREEISLSHLQQLGVSVPPIYVTADSAFLLQPATEEKAKEILSKAGIDGSDRSLIGMTIGWSNRISETNTTWYLRPMKSVFRASSMILPKSMLEFARRQIGHFGRLDIASYPKVREAAQIVDYLVEKLDATVVLVPHDYNPGADDRILLGEILQSVKQRNRVRLLTGDYSAPEIKAVIGQCDLFIGGKMHSSIAATSMCVPTVAIQYNHKFYGIMRLLGQEEYVCDKLIAEEVEARVDQAWAGRERIRGELEANIGIVKQRARYNAELVADLLNSDRGSGVS